MRTGWQELGIFWCFWQGGGASQGEQNPTRRRETGPVGYVRSCVEHGSTHKGMSCAISTTRRGFGIVLWRSRNSETFHAGHYWWTKIKICIQLTDRLANPISTLFVCTKGITSVATRIQDLKKSCVPGFMLDAALSCSPALGGSSRRSDELPLQSHPQR
jgi:hypothetical protein